MKPPRNPLTQNPRSDAKLKRLPAELQAEIIRRLHIPGKEGSTEAVSAWLKEQGIDASSGTVSNFSSWWELRESLRARNAKVDRKIEELSQEDKYSPEQLFSVGQKMFAMLAIQDEDVKAWFLTQTLGLKKDDGRREQEKIEILTCEKFLAWFKDKRARDIAESNVSTPDKIKALRQTYFADIEELEKSGEVKLPA